MKEEASMKIEKATYIFYGEEQWLLKKRVAEIKKAVFADDQWALEYNLVTFETKNITMKSLLENLNIMPFMGEKRLVILEGAELFTFGGKSGEEQKKNDEQLIAYLNNPNPACVLIICNYYLPEKKNEKAYSKFAALDMVAVEKFEALKPQAVKLWVKDYLKAYNSSIDLDALDYLTASSSRSLGILANELDKALTYTGKKRLSLEDIKQIITPTAEDSSFLLLNCLVDRKSNNALKALRNLLYYGSNEYQLLAFLEGQYIKMLLIKDYAKRSVSKQEMKKLLNIKADFALDSLLRQSKAYQEKELLKILEMLLDCEMDFKTMSNVNERMERLLVEMCNALEN